jgi:hypothetical protein
MFEIGLLLSRRRRWLWLHDPGYSNAPSVNATTAAGLSHEILKKS